MFYFKRPFKKKKPKPTGLSLKLDIQYFFDFILEKFHKSDSVLKMCNGRNKKKISNLPNNIEKPKVEFVFEELPKNTQGMFISNTLEFDWMGKKVLIAASKIIVDVGNIWRELRYTEKERELIEEIKKVLIHEAAHWFYKEVLGIESRWIDKMWVVGAYKKLIIIFYGFLVGCGLGYLAYLNIVLFPHLVIPTILLLMCFSMFSFKILDFFALLFEFSPHERFANKMEINNKILTDKRWNDIIYLEIIKNNAAQ